MQNLKSSYLKQLADECVQSYVLDKRPQTTIVNLRNFLGRFLLWMEDRELTVKECRAYVKYMKSRDLAWSSVASDTRRLKMFLSWLKIDANDGDGVIETNWVKEVRSPKKYGGGDKEPEQLLSPEKMMEYVLRVTEPGSNDTRLHKEVKLEHREFLLFFMKTGLRPGEAINIDPKRVNLDGSPPSVMIYRSKNDVWQPIGLPLDYLEPIRKRVEAGRWFRVNQRRLQIYMRRISKMAGRKVNLYSIRKSVDTFAMDADAPVMKLSVHQGHTVATMQKYYTKFSAKQSSEVNNSYNPWIDRTKLPVDFMLPKVKSLAKELGEHPQFKVVPGERSLLIEW